jgi:hypothetical protein
MYDGAFPESVHFMDLRLRKSHLNVSSWLLIHIYEQTQPESFWRQEITCIFHRRIVKSMFYSFHQIHVTQNSESNHPVNVKRNYMLRSYQSLSHTRICQHLMEPECSVLCSQEPSNGPYFEPDESKSISSHPISLRSILVLSSDLRS